VCDGVSGACSVGAVPWGVVRNDINDEKQIVVESNLEVKSVSKPFVAIVRSYFVAS
jgi:hypothetical protein